MTPPENSFLFFLFFLKISPKGHPVLLSLSFDTIFKRFINNLNNPLIDVDNTQISITPTTLPKPCPCAPVGTGKPREQPSHKATSAARTSLCMAI